MVNYYEILELNPTLSCEELQKELKKAQRKWVNRTNAADLRKRQEAESKVVLIGEALNIFTDPSKKSEYDIKISNVNNHSTEVQQIDTDLDISALLKRAQECLDNKRYVDAITYAKKVTEAVVNNANAWYMLGWGYYGWNEPQLAEDAFKKAISIQPKDVYLYYGIVELYLNYNQVSNAEIWINQGLAVDADDFKLRWMLADIYVSKGDYENGLIILKELVVLQPENKELKEDIAWKYYHKGLSNCYYNQADEKYYTISKEGIEEMQRCMYQAKYFLEHSEFDDKISWGEEQLKKTFDGSLWPVFIFPIGFMLLGTVAEQGDIIIGSVLVCIPLIFLCMRPGWSYRKKELLGEKSIMDNMATGSIYLGKIVGIIITFCFTVALTMLKNSTK